MKKHIYLAGSLFSEAEVAQRLKEGKIIKETFGDKYTLYNPIEAPCNDKEANLPSCIDIFMADTEEVLKSDIIIADLANQDPGVMMELGIAWGLCGSNIRNNGNVKRTKGILKSLWNKKKRHTSCVK